jgi:hypothetical protein
LGAAHWPLNLAKLVRRIGYSVWCMVYGGCREKEINKKFVFYFVENTFCKVYWLIEVCLGCGGRRRSTPTHKHLHKLGTNT